jgi:hypothetical protein
MCNAIKWSFTAIYIFLLTVNAWGFLNSERPDFSFLFMSLGLPWTLFLDPLGETNSLIGVSPDVLTMLAPAINLAILFSICSTLRRRRNSLRLTP